MVFLKEIVLALLCGTYVPYVSVVVRKSCVYRARGHRRGRTREHETSPKAFRDIRYDYSLYCVLGE